MKALRLSWILMALAGLACASCGEDTEESVSGTDNTDTDSADTDQCESAKMTILDMNFDDGQGAGNRLIIARPTEDTEGSVVVTLDSDSGTSEDSAGDTDNSKPAPEGDTASDTTPVDTASDTTPVDTASDTTPVDTASDTTPVDTASDTTPVDTASDTTPADTASDTTPVDTASDTTPADTAADAMTYYIYPDNNTSVEWDGHPNALKIHADAQDDAGYGKSVEIQLALDAPVDMTCEDYVVSFDIWAPKALIDAGGNAQFAFFDAASNTPIYSHWFDVESSRWVTVTGEVKVSGGDIDYSEFEDNPGDWVFDAFRLKIIADSAAEGQEFEYYVDNIKVTNIPDAAADTSVAASGQ